MNVWKVLAVGLTAAMTVVGGAANAHEPPTCSGTITRANVVPCALAASLLVRGEQQELEAARARKAAVSPLLPSNPVLALSAAKRSTAELGATNWYATLSQEIEIAGQRGVRRDAAEAAAQAQSKRVLLSRRETAAQASIAFFEAIAAREERRLAEQLTAATEAVAVAARARAERGLIAQVDADVADATTVRVLQVKLAAERRASRALATLGFLLGRSATQLPPTVDGELIPLVQKPTSPVGERPELEVLHAERRALSLRADAFRRARIPNPSLSLFAQNDGFNERVLGAGIAFPIPLPGNVGRTNRGEIAEAEALAARAGTDRERIEREIRLEIATASQAFESRGQEVSAFTAERLARAEKSLQSLGEEVRAGRLAVRDAAVAQQALIELLRASVEARREWCLASVELARALGVPLEGVSP